MRGSRFRAPARGGPPAPPPLDREKFVQPSPPLTDDMYGELVPPTIASLLGHLEEVGMQVEDLFAGDPSVIEINDVLDELRETEGGADLHELTRGDPRLAAAALAAYTRQLPKPLLCTPHVEALFQGLMVEDYAHRVAALRDTCAELPEANLAVLHRLCHFLNRLGDSRTCAPGNELAALALFWSAMLLPPGAPSRSRAHRVKEYRVVALLLQQSHCVFQGALETHEVCSSSSSSSSSSTR
jgi:hypothetical protein